MCFIRKAAEWRFSISHAVDDHPTTAAKSTRSDGTERQWCRRPFLANRILRARSVRHILYTVADVFEYFEYCVPRSQLKRCIIKMPSKLVTTIIVVCVALAAVVYAVNVYFLNRLDASTAGQFATAQKLEYHIRRTMRHLHPSYLNRNPRFFGVRNKLLRNLQSSNYENASTVWEISHWVSGLSCVCVCVV